MKTVLLCEDDDDMVRLIRSVVERAGYHLVTAPDGQAALTVARTQTPDLVLMDLRMPRLDGVAATRALRAAGFKNPIIILTASEKPADREAARAAGCSGFILKTLVMSEVEDALGRLLGSDDGDYELKP